MAEKVTLKLPAAAAPYVRGGAAKAEKLKAARGEVPFSAGDLATLLLFLSLDADPEVKAAAVRSLREMPNDLLMEIVSNPETHPRVIDLLARVHYDKGEIIARLLVHPALEVRTVEFLATKEIENLPAVENPENGQDEGGATPGEEGGKAKEQEEDALKGKEFQSRYKLYLHMGVATKVKIAITGDKEWRTMLIKDNNKVVAVAVIKNPRITEPEIAAIVKSNVKHDEILRLICKSKEWTKNYRIRKALIENFKTPLPDALRLLPSLTQRDLAAMAKNKNVPTAISTNARRLFLNRNKYS